MKKAVLVFTAFCFLAAALPAAEFTFPRDYSPKLQLEFLQDRTPQEYEKDELPQWLRTLRRGEIIFFGSMPFTILFSSLGYRTGKYAYNYFTAEPGSVVPGWNEVDRDDQIRMICITLGLSLSIAITDYIIGKVQGRNK